MNLPGRLRMTTLGDVLGTLHRAGATGTLEIAEDTGRNHRVHLTGGLVVAVEIDGAAPTLADVLRADHGVSPELLRRALLRAVSSRRLLGEVLVTEFRVDAASVGAALRRQRASRLERLDRIRDARLLFRVAVRTPRGALTDAPLPARQFLHGRRRARDEKAATPRPPAGGAPDARPRSGGTAQLRDGSLREDACREVARRVLGVPPTAAAPDIRRAYRSLVRTLHPDMNPQATDDEKRALALRFQAVTEAYRALVA